MVKRRRYELLSCLGQGGFGAVFRARMISSGAFEREVALKVLRDDSPEGVHAVERLRDEARMLGLLQHPNIVQVLHLTRIDPGWAVVMELVEGIPLSTFAREGTAVPPAIVADLGVQAADALWAAWSTCAHGGRPLQVLHRDIKPSNLQLSDRGQLKVLDFGIASASMPTREAHTGPLVLGTLQFMSPERQVGEDSHAGDVYALGATLVELLRGQPWLRMPGAPTAHEERVDSLLRSVPGLPQPMYDTLRSMLAYYPEQRPTARVAERALFDYRRATPYPTLRDWCEEVVVPLRHSREVDTTGAGTSYLERDTSVSGDIDPTPEASSRRTAGG